MYNLDDAVKNSQRNLGISIPVVLEEGPSLVEIAVSRMNEANAKVGPARHVTTPVIEEIVVREYNSRAGMPIRTANFGVLRAVDNFLSVATQNVSTTPHTDLLPLGHPLLERDGSLTASAYNEERANWEAGTLDASPQLRAIVASFLNSDSDSAEHKFARVRLMSSAPDVLARLA